ncbi:MAG: hypothetical protein AAF383_09585, partial [Cyanobacteria bacterium P01_A01_bin.83]
IVEIETLEPSAFNTLEILQRPTQPQEIVAVACPSEKGASTSQLTITGRGGLPNRPQELLTAQSMIEFEDSATVDQAERSPESNNQTLPPPAQNWYRDANGTIVLTDRAVGTLSSNAPGKAIDCNQG